MNRVSVHQLEVVLNHPTSVFYIKIALILVPLTILIVLLRDKVPGVLIVIGIHRGLNLNVTYELC